MKPSTARELFATCALSGLHAMAVSMSAPLIPLQVVRLGVDPGVLGVLLSLAAFGALTAALPTGYVVRRLGTRLPLVASALVTALVCVYIFSAPALPGLIVGLLLFGACRTVFAVSIQSHVGGLELGTDVSANFGWYGMGVSGGQIAGPLVAGLVIDRFGLGPAWLIMAGIGAALAAGVPLTMGPGSVVQERPEVAPSRRLSLKDIVSWGTLIGVIASFTTVFALGVRESFYPVYLKGLGYPAAVTGAMMSARGIVSLLSRFSLGPLVRMARERFNLLCLCMAALALAIGTTFLCRTIPLLVVNSIMVGASFGLAIPLTQAMVFGSVPAAERGIAMGMRMTANRLAQFTGPILFGLVTQAGGISAAFSAGGSLMLLITGILFVAWSRLSGRGRTAR